MSGQPHEITRRGLRIHREHQGDSGHVEHTELPTEKEVLDAGEAAARHTGQWMNESGLSQRISPETRHFMTKFVRAASEFAFLYGDELPERSDLLAEIANRFAPKLGEENRELVRQSQTDSLTGLANKAAFERAVNTAEKDSGTSFVFIDANNFGQINKQISHDVGDEALKGVAEHLRVVAREVLGTDERIFRRGGDEFVVIVPHEKAEEFSRSLTERYGATTDVIDWDKEERREYRPSHNSVSSRGTYITKDENRVGYVTYGRGDTSVTVSLSVGTGDTVQEADAASQVFKRELKKEFGKKRMRNIGKRVLRAIFKKHK